MIGFIAVDVNGLNKVVAGCPLFNSPSSVQLWIADKHPDKVSPCYLTKHHFPTGEPFTEKSTPFVIGKIEYYLTRTHWEASNMHIDLSKKLADKLRLMAAEIEFGNSLTCINYRDGLIVGLEADTDFGALEVMSDFTHAAPSTEPELEGDRFHSSSRPA